MKMCDVLKKDSEIILQEIKRLSGKPLKGITVEFEYTGSVEYNMPYYDMGNGKYLIPAFYKKGRRLFQTKDFMQQIADLTDCIVVKFDYQYIPTKISKKYNVKNVHVEFDEFLGFYPIKENKYCVYNEHFVITATAKKDIYYVSLGYDNIRLMKYPYDDEKFDMFIDNKNLSDILKETKEKFNIDSEFGLFYDECKNLYVNYIVPDIGNTIDVKFNFTLYLEDAFIYHVNPLKKKLPSDAKKYLKERLQEFIKEDM